MKTRSKALLAGAALALAVVPAGLVLAGGNSSIGDVNQQAASWHGREAAPKNWKTVPGIFATSGDTSLIATTVSAQMVRGKAKFRIAEFDGSDVVQPGPVLFSAKAANSFTWGRHGNCPGNPHVIQWKRVGKADAVAAKLSAHSVLDEFCL